MEEPKKTSHAQSQRKPGGQQGRQGVTLELDNHPDVVHELIIDTDLLPEGNYTDAGYERRQVIDIEITRVVTEYQAHILKNDQGKKFVAAFPDGIHSRIQYGNGLKTHAMYLSQYQLLPYERIREYFADQLSIPISEGSLYNFIDSAYQQLQQLDVTARIKAKLLQAQTVHADETGMNINGQRHWLHNASSKHWTYLSVHTKRGKDAMDEIGILPHFDGVLCHDHWKPYYQYDTCEHSLCNAHHLRELTRAHEQDKQVWAEHLKNLLLKINQDVNNTEDKVLTQEQQQAYITQYQALLNAGEKESPKPTREQGQRGRLKKTTSRNLLERLRDYQDDVLRFMTATHIPFTNNQGENDLRMVKLQQKISGCFRNDQGARMFFALRSYLSSCKKQGVSSSTALSLLFSGHLPNVFEGGE